MERFLRYCVIRKDVEWKILDVKRYTDVEEYDREIDIMASAFESYNEAVRECRRVAKMCNGKSLV